MERVTQNHQLFTNVPFYYTNNGETALITSDRLIQDKPLVMPLPVARAFFADYFNPATTHHMEVQRRIPGEQRAQKTRECRPLTAFPADALETRVSFPSTDSIVTDEDALYIFVRPKNKEDIPARTLKKPLSDLKQKLPQYHHKHVRREPLEAIEQLRALEDTISPLTKLVSHAPFHTPSDLTDAQSLLTAADHDLHMLLAYYHQQHTALETIKKGIILRPFQEEDRSITDALCHTIYDGKLGIPHGLSASQRKRLLEERARFYNELHAEFPAYVLGFYQDRLLSAVHFPREKKAYVHPATKNEEIFDGFLMETINLDPAFTSSLFPENTHYAVYTLADAMTAYAQQAGAHGIVIRDQHQNYPMYFSRRGFTHKTRQEHDPFGKPRLVHYYLKTFTPALQSSHAGADHQPGSGPALTSYAV